MNKVCFICLNGRVIKKSRKFKKLENVLCFDCYRELEKLKEEIYFIHRNLTDDEYLKILYKLIHEMQGQHIDNILDELVDSGKIDRIEINGAKLYRKVA